MYHDVRSLSELCMRPILQGYGFIMPADGTEDVFVHQTQIRRAGFRFLAVSNLRCSPIVNFERQIYM